jgi:multidrug resistance efflux pump
MKKLNSFHDELETIAASPAQNNLKERSEMVHEIISRKPNFIEKWALSIFGGILLMLLASLWFITYPDTIETRAVLTSENAPKEIISRQEGRVIKFFFRNNDNVKKNEILGWVESMASHSEVLKLSKQLDSGLALLHAGALEKACTIFNATCTNLGEIQPVYQNFNLALNTFRDYLVNGFYYRKKNMLEKDIQFLQKTIAAIQQQRSLIEQDIELARQTYEMNKNLYDQNVLSKEEFRGVKSRFVNKQLELPQNEASLLSNETAINAKLKEIQQLDHDMLEQRGIYYQALGSLKSSVDEWKRKYLITSPIEGRLTLVIPIQENQLLTPGKTIGYVNPSDSRMYMQTNLPQYNFGKIKQGLDVQLRFDAYPYQEVGYVEGTLQHISNIPTDSGFLATIYLKNGLVTNQNKAIFFKSGLNAQALIITKNMTLLERLWYSLTKNISINK